MTALPSQTGHDDIIPSGPWELQLVARQLWWPLVSSGDYRLALNTVADPDWEVVRRFSVIPSAKAPRLLVGVGDRRPVARALSTFGGIRTRRQRLGRLTTATATRFGLARRGDLLTLERRVGSRPTEPEPLAFLERELGRPLNTIVGVRTGANSKATVQLFSEDGQPVGYAKVGWNPITQDYVRRESEVLRELNGSAGRLRVPTVLASGAIGESHFLVTHPLPLDVTTLPPGHHLSVEDFAGVAPVRRFDSMGGSGQFRALSDRVMAGSGVELGGDTWGRARSLATTLGSSSLRMPVAARWHGDLVPWNAARDSTGGVWVWDWETCEDDAVAGLDVLHWSINTHENRAPADTTSTFVDSVVSCAPMLRALGLGRRQQLAVASLYALALAERSMQLASGHGGWHYNRLQPAVLDHLLRVGQDLAEQASDQRPH